MFRAVLCGCGAMAKGWLKALAETPTLRDTVLIAGLVDLNLATARALTEEFNLKDAIIGDDLEDVLIAANADLLFDVVVPPARRQVVEIALRHGCHVLSEKPMATSLEDGRVLIELARTAGKVHAIVQNRRFISGVRRIQKFIESGSLGQLTSLHCDFFIGPHFGGFREEMDNVLLLDMAIHTFDAARFMAGKIPLAVYCQESNPTGSWYKHGASANAIFEFSDNVTFSYRGSWCAEGVNTSWEGEWRLIGTKGTLLWDGADAFDAKIVNGDSGFIRDVGSIEIPTFDDETQTQRHASVIANFISAVQKGTVPETNSNDNIKSLAMVFGAIESAKSQSRVLIAA